MIRRLTTTLRHRLYAELGERIAPYTIPLSVITRLAALEAAFEHLAGQVDRLHSRVAEFDGGTVRAEEPKA